MSKGIDHLKSAIKFLIVAAQKIATADSNGDHKISWMESLNIIMSVGWKIPGMIKDFPEIRDEWKDLTPAELDELVKWFQLEFDLPGVEKGKIEQIIKLLAANLARNYTDWKELQALLAL